MGEPVNNSPSSNPKLWESENRSGKSFWDIWN